MATKNVDAWFEDVPSSQRATLLELRKLILSAAPDAVEEVKWSRPCYSTARGLFCYLHSTRSHATLGFQKGASLEDPARLLEGTGKEMRHIKFPGSLGTLKASVRKLLRDAAGLAR